jgi:hypothetical protein
MTSRGSVIVGRHATPICVGNGRMVEGVIMTLALLRWPPVVGTPVNDNATLETPSRTSLTKETPSDPHHTRE